MKFWTALAGGFTAGMVSVAAFAAEHHGEAAAGGEHSSSGLPQFDPSTYPSQIFWLAVTFVVLLIFFSKKTLPEISGVIEKRREHIQSDLDIAERLKAEAVRAQGQYESLMDGARAESTKLLADAAASAKAGADKELQAFRERSSKKLDDLDKRLAQGRKQALSDMNAIAAEIAAEAAAKIAGIKTDIKQAQTVVQSLNKKEAA